MIEQYGISRRGLIGGVAGLAAMQASGALGQALPLPKSAVALNIIDVGGAPGARPEAA